MLVLLERDALERRFTDDGGKGRVRENREDLVCSKRHSSNVETKKKLRPIQNFEIEVYSFRRKNKKRYRNDRESSERHGKKKNRGGRHANKKESCDGTGSC